MERLRSTMNGMRTSRTSTAKDQAPDQDHRLWMNSWTPPSQPTSELREISHPLTTNDIRKAIGDIKRRTHLNPKTIKVSKDIGDDIETEATIVQNSLWRETVPPDSGRLFGVPFRVDDSLPPSTVMVVSGVTEDESGIMITAKMGDRTVVGVDPRKQMLTREVEVRLVRERDFDPGTEKPRTSIGSLFPQISASRGGIVYGRDHNPPLDGVVQRITRNEIAMRVEGRMLWGDRSLPNSFVNMDFNPA